MIFFLYLTSSKILSFGYEKKIYAFLLHFTHLSVSLTPLKILSLGKIQIHLVFLSLIRIFAAFRRFKLYEEIPDPDPSHSHVSVHDGTDRIHH